MVRQGLILAVFALGLSWAQSPTAPVVGPRGVVNAFTQQPAPTYVAPGGILWITGLNLGPPEGAQATGSPLPTELGGVKVFIANQPIPLLSVSPGKIVAQVPWDAAASPQGNLLQLSVEYAGTRSRNAGRFYVRTVEPAIRTVGDTGFGEADVKRDGNTLRLSATGLGPVELAVEDGYPGAADLSVKPRAELRAYAGGLPAKVSAALSPDRVGEFDVLIEIPPEAKSGDVVQLFANNRAANRVTFGRLREPEVQFLKIPDGADIRTLSGSDLRGTFVLASGPRDEKGCYPSYIFDFSRQNVAGIDACLTSANRNSPNPFVPVNDGAAVSAFVGPSDAEPQQGFSAKLKIFNPELPQPLDISLPSPASALQGLGGDTVVAVLPGPPASAVGIDVRTGEVRTMEAGGGQGGGGNPVAPGAPGLTVDLGDGLNHVLTQRIAIAANRTVVAVGDDENKPKKAKLAILDQRGAVVSSEDFPEGFVPLVAPAAPSAGQGQVIQQLAARIRVSINYDTQTRTLYVMSRKPDNSAHGFAAFTIAQEVRSRALPYPDGWFAPACSANIPIYSLELSRTLAVLGSNTAEGEFKQVCEALGFVIVDLANQRLRSVPLAGAGKINAASVIEMNDYLLATNIGGARQPADTLHMLNGVDGTASRLQLPPGVSSFAGLRAIGTAGLFLAVLQRNYAGDEGFVVFDLESAQARVLPVPDGFQLVQLVDIYPATRQVLARGTKTGNTGAQYLVYDLMSTDLALIPNPNGVAWVGAVPAQAVTPGGGAGGGPGGGGAGGGGVVAQPQTPTIYQDSNPKANTVSAVCFDAGRKPVGVMLARLP